MSGGLRIEGRLANQAQKITRTRGQAMATTAEATLKVSVMEMLPGTAAPGPSMPKPHTRSTAATGELSSLGLDAVSGPSPAFVSLHHSP